MLKQHAVAAEVSAAVRDEVRKLLEENDAAPAEVSPENHLNMDLGLSSLDLARLVAALEMRLKADPFQELVAVTSVRTVGDLESAYMAIFSDWEEAQEDDLLAIRRRAEARREDSEGVE